MCNQDLKYFNLDLNPNTDRPRARPLKNRASSSFDLFPHPSTDFLILHPCLSPVKNAIQFICPTDVGCSTSCPQWKSFCYDILNDDDDPPQNLTKCKVRRDARRRMWKRKQFPPDNTKKHHLRTVQPPKCVERREWNKQTTHAWKCGWWCIQSRKIFVVVGWGR